MITLKSLQLRDFLSHKDTTLDFNQDENLLIDGDSGGGKSAVFEGIIWALYGQGRADNRSLIRRGCKRAEVTLVLYDDRDNLATTYAIKRNITQGGKQGLQILVNAGGKTPHAHELTGLRELQTWIETKFIGASYLLFVNSIAYLQGGAESFVAQNAARRKELLLEIVRAGDFEAFYEKTREVISSKEGQRTEAVAKSEAINRWLENAKTLVADKPRLTSLLERFKLDIVGFEEKKGEIMKKLADKKGAEDQYKLALQVGVLAQQGVDSAKKALDNCTQASTELETLVKLEPNLAEVKKEADALDVKISASETLVLTHAQRGEERSKLLQRKPIMVNPLGAAESARLQIERIHALAKCPSGEACPHQKHSYESIARYEKEIKDSEKKAEEDAVALLAWQKEYDALPAQEDLTAVVTTLNEMKGRRTILRTQQNEIEQKLSQRARLEKEVSNKPVYEKMYTDALVALGDSIRKAEDLAKSIDKEAIMSLETDLAMCESELKLSRNKEAEVNGELMATETFEKQMPQSQAEFDTLSKDILAKNEQVVKLQLLKDAFGSKGIRAIVIDYLLPNLEEKINWILSKMSDFRVHLDTQQEKADGEGNKEGLFITIINEMNEEMPFENYSGGEKLKIVVAISEALASLQNVGFRLFDEVFVGLDENSTESFALVMERLQEKFSQVLCISHLQQVKDMFDKRVIIVKNNGISTPLFDEHLK